MTQLNKNNQQNMQKINQLDRTNLQLLRQELDAAVAAVAERHGLQIKVGTCTYQPTNATFKLVVNTVSDGGVVQDQFRANWGKYAGMLGLDASMLDQVVSWGGKQYKIVGLNPNKGRCPVLAERQDGSGKQFFVPTDAARKR